MKWYRYWNVESFWQNIYASRIYPISAFWDNVMFVNNLLDSKTKPKRHIPVVF